MKIRNMVAVAVLGLTVGGARAQDAAVQEPEASGWDLTTTLYGWITQMDGDIGVGPVTVPLDVGMDDTIDAIGDLEGALMLHVEAKRGPCSIIGDVYHINLDVDQSTPVGEASLELKQTIGEVALAHELPIDCESLSVEALAGARYSMFDVGIDINSVGVNADADESWVDPLVGGRLIYAACPKTLLSLRGDVGGFGVGSDLTWNAVAAAQYAFADHWSLALAYRILDVDYDDDGFVYNVQEDGPAVGVGYTW